MEKLAEGEQRVKEALGVPFDRLHERVHIRSVADIPKFHQYEKFESYSEKQ